jgi:hypothetical protein
LANNLFASNDNADFFKLNLAKAADTIFRAPSSSSNIFIIRIIGGGEGNIQTSQLIAAIQELNLHQSLYSIELLTCDHINTKHYSIKSIVDWAIAGHMHLISCHVHQGIQLQIINSRVPGKNSFNLESMMGQLQRLQYHSGFPTGDKLKCPVFLQDKYEYLAVLQKQNWCNPTLKVVRPDLGSLDSDQEQHNQVFDEASINRINFFLDNCKEEGSGWVVKLPFVTNQRVQAIKTKGGCN